jgi:hypothetical protein
MKSKLTQMKFLDPDNLGSQGQKLMNFLVSERGIKTEKAYDISEKILHSDQPKLELLGLFNIYHIPQDQANELAMDILGDI